MNFAITVLAFIVALGVLIVFHEFGHYVIARLFGVKVLRFSVGFGRALWRTRRGRDQTEWVIAALPLGGYVKMLDEREGPVAPEEAHRAFNRQSVWRRIAIVVAGPVANFLLAIVFYWALFVGGVQEAKPVVGAPDAGTVAAASGLTRGETILKTNGAPRGDRPRTAAHLADSGPVEFRSRGSRRRSSRAFGIEARPARCCADYRQGRPGERSRGGGIAPGGPRRFDRWRGDA